ncbi:MAG: hypothetical protein ACRD3B_12610 [Candidatus Sulfotelmatobacter sp.]
MRPSHIRWNGIGDRKVYQQYVTGRWTSSYPSQTSRFLDVETVPFSGISIKKKGREIARGLVERD